MIRAGCLAACLVVLAGCASLPMAPPDPSPCAKSEASYECQVERYHNINVP